MAKEVTPDQMPLLYALMAAETYLKFVLKRDKSTKRRYGRAWKRIRDKYAAEHPFCELCFERGIIVPTEEIHHKLPLSPVDIGFAPTGAETHRG